jgi:hypothetical protein
MPYNLLMPEKEDHRSPQPWWLSVWQRRWWIALATLFILVWWLVPPLLYRHTGTANDAKLKAITDTRTALLAGLIGVGALLTFWLNSRVYRITEQGHITERYTKAIEQPPRGGGAGHEHDRGEAVAVGDGAVSAAVWRARRDRRQGRHQPPQLVGYELVNEGRHGAGSCQTCPTGAKRRLNAGKRCADRPFRR